MGSLEQMLSFMCHHMESEMGSCLAWVVPFSGGASLTMEVKSD